MKRFEIIEDTRFSVNAESNVLTWSEQIFNDLKSAGAIVHKEQMRTIDFKGSEPCKSFRVTFYIERYLPKPTFKDMQSIINKTKAVRLYNFNRPDTHLTNKGLVHTINI